MQKAEGESSPPREEQYRFRDNLDRIFDELPPEHIANFLPDVNFAFDTFEWEDPAWGPTTVDQSWGGIDRDNPSIDYTHMFKELLVHPAIKRLIGIEQLTLPPQYETLPNAARFSRWEHITGSALLVRDLVDEWNAKNPANEIDNRKKVIYMLRTMLSDVGHTIGSHLGDWIMDDHHEKEHDIQLKKYIEQNGVGDILARYRITLDEVILTEVEEEDFVECPSPDLCIDRVDYAVREIHRTNRFFDDPGKRFTAKDFKLVKIGDSFQMVMHDPQRALEFAKAYELLPKEDWSEPLQRLQTTIYTDLIKLVLIAIADGQLRTPIATAEWPPFAGDDLADVWIAEPDRHPRDILMYAETVISATIDSAYGLLGNSRGYSASPTLQTICHLDYLMRSISEIAKSHFYAARSDEIVTFMAAVTSGAASPNTQIKDRDILHTPCSSSLVPGGGVTVEFQPLSDGSSEPGVAKVTLAERKKRVIDPTLYIDGQVTRLSQISEYAINSDAYTALSATLTCEDPELGDALTQAKTIIDAEWGSLQSRERISAAQLRDMQYMGLTSTIAATDYWKYTRRGALLDEEWAEDLAAASAWAARE